jgi:hypothetical protein
MARIAPGSGFKAILEPSDSLRQAVFSLRENPPSLSAMVACLLLPLVAYGDLRPFKIEICGMEQGIDKSKKGGRPKKTVVRERTTGIRFSKTEYFIVQEKAKQAGLKMTVYIRQSAIQAKIISRLTMEEKLQVQNLIGQSRNINQIAKACHTEGVLRALLYFENFRSKIDLILQKIKS